MKFKNFFEKSDESVERTNPRADTIRRMKTKMKKPPTIPENSSNHFPPKKVLTIPSRSNVIAVMVGFYLKKSKIVLKFTNGQPEA